MSYDPKHFRLAVAGKVATVTLDRPERKNPLTFDSYAELRDWFRALAHDKALHAVVITGAGGNFCSGGDVFEIIEPLTKMDMPGLLDFTRMTGDVVRAMRACPQPIVAAVDGVCAGAGAIIAMASDLRLGTARSRTAFLFNRVGLAGCDMGACAILPRIIGQGRASELLYTGRAMSGEEGGRWGFFNRLTEAETLLAEAQALAASIAEGPSFANGITKTQLHQEWSMSVDQAIESEAQAQAICMATGDFRRAFEAFAAKRKPVFEGAVTDRSYLDWPFFEPWHRALADEVEDWAAGRAEALADAADVDASCRRLVAAMGQAGLLRHAVPEPGARLDVRALCLIRDILARHAGLADFAFAMQGLGTGAITLFGTDAQRAAILPGVRAGTALAGFALSERAAGSDVAALAMSAIPNGPDWVLEGEKTWISNGGIAAHYIVFARTGAGTKGISAFAVPADTPGLVIAERIETIAPHPLATLRFSGCRVPAAALIGRPGDGFRIALSVLDVFRATVGAAALGLARRALADSLRHAGARQLFGAPLAAMPVTQAALADMATEVDAAALLVYRAAWVKDAGAERVTREASMAKLYATEAAQRVVDRAVQLHGGLGVTKGNKVEELYREVRALRIYEGASEVQRVVIARQILEDRQ